MAANHRFNRNKQPIEWHDVYCEVLENIGWTMKGRGLTDYKASGGKFSVFTEMLKLLLAAATGDELKLFGATVKSLEKLKDGDDRVVLFETQSHELNQGSCQVGSVIIESGMPTMNVGSVFFKTTDNVTRVLFFSFLSASSGMKYCSEKICLDDHIFNRLLTIFLDLEKHDAMDSKAYRRTLHCTLRPSRLR